MLRIVVKGACLYVSYKWGQIQVYHQQQQQRNTLAQLRAVAQKQKSTFIFPSKLSEYGYFMEKCLKQWTLPELLGYPAPWYMRLRLQRSATMNEDYWYWALVANGNQNRTQWCGFEEHVKKGYLDLQRELPLIDNDRFGNDFVTRTFGNPLWDDDEDEDDENDKKVALTLYDIDNANNTVVFEDEDDFEKRLNRF